MRFWRPLANKLLSWPLSLILLLSLGLLVAGGNGGLFSESSVSSSARAAELSEILTEAADTTPELREERENLKDLERQIELLEAEAGWQLGMSGSYSRGEREEAFSPDIPDNNGENDLDLDNSIDNNIDNDISTTDNDNNNNNDLESFSDFQLGFTGSRAFLAGLEIEGGINYFDDDPLDLDEFSDNITLSIEGRYQLWPQLPTPALRQLEQLEEQREIAELEYTRAREEFFQDLLADYSEIALLQEELRLAEANLALTEQEMERLKKQREKEEAGELALRELEIALKQAENSISTLERSQRTAREDFAEKLGEAEEPDYRLDDGLWQLLEDSFTPLAQALEEQDFPGLEEDLLEQMLAFSPEYQALSQELAQSEEDLEYHLAERQPTVSFSAESPDLEAREWEVLLAVDYDLYDSGVSELEAEGYEDDITSLEKDMEEFNNSLSRQLEANFDTIADRVSELEMAELEVERAQLEVAQQEEAYERGALESYELKELEISKEEDQLAQREAELELLLSRIELLVQLDELLIEEVL